MIRIARLFLSLSATRMGDLRTRIGHRILFAGLLAVFALLAAGFGLAAVTAAIAAELGLVPALAIMSFVAALCCLIVLLVMLATERKQGERTQHNAELQKRLTQAATLAAFGRPARLGRLAGIGLLVGAMVLLFGGSDHDDRT